MKLQVLGLGCPNCLRLVANAEQAVRELGADFAVENTVCRGRDLSVLDKLDRLSTVHLIGSSTDRDQRQISASVAGSV